jgi:hypothetical protein
MHFAKSNRTKNSVSPLPATGKRLEEFEHQLNDDQPFALGGLPQTTEFPALRKELHENLRESGIKRTSKLERRLRKSLNVTTYSRTEN